MRSIIILALCVCVLSIEINNESWTNREQEQIMQIKASKWGNWVIDFAEAHLQAKGPLQELLQNISDLVEELETSLDELVKQFNKRTDQHNKDVQRLQQDIDDADRDIFNSQDFIDNVLIPQQDRLERNLAQLAENIAQNRKNLDQETLQRTNEHNSYLERAAEHQSAIDACDKSLSLISQLQNPSLVEIREIQGHLHKLDKQLNNHSIFAPMIKALLELATEQNFASQDAVGEIVKAFTDLRKELVNSLNQENADEATAQKNFEERVKQLNTEHTEFQRQVLLRTAELTRTQEKRTETDSYLKQRKIDRDTLKGQLDLENSNYAAETDIFNGLRDEYQKELDASQKALALLTQPSFTDYVNRKLGF